MKTHYLHRSPGEDLGEETPARIKGARIWDWMAHRYAAKLVPDENAYAHKLAVTREYLFPTANVLELGCGTGSTALHHAPHVRHIDAFDFSASMIDIARRKAAAGDVKNIAFRCREANNLCAADARYNVVLAMNLLHLLPEWQQVIEQIHDQLRPGGVFISTTPCLHAAPRILRWVAPVGFRIGVMPYLSFFSQGELAAAQTEAGFDLEYAWQATPQNGLFMVVRKSC